MRLPALEHSDGQSMSKISEEINFALPVPAHSTWPGVSRFQHVIRLLYPSTVQLRNVQPLPGHVHSLYLLKLSNENELILKFALLSAAPLMRREQLSLETEALALDLLRQTTNQFIPQLIHYAPDDRSLGAGFLLRQYVKGPSLLENEHRLSPQARKDIEQDLGLLVSVIGQNVSTAFGPLTKVAAGTGSSSWRRSFILLFEEVIHDAEDMLIHLPYSQLREQLCRFASTLDEIKVPRLTVINFGRPSDVLLDSDFKRLSGILDLSTAIWGDVLMAEVFEEPTEALFTGFGSIPSKGPSQSVRFLLYSCYRHVYRITELYYRNRTDDMTEMHARRKLTDALQLLSTTEVE
ncbi:hypothetical protein PISL3812_02932 [Talaromyces islandicus]|uniref:Uncharacterized protein n=1 Tax=Talaromyces islandicus TaxID=28573 RepID=A0A0U1LR97_TALIS|nr:hypothetical protein PISL3812_02932 [Talaromyces islandicus]